MNKGKLTALCHKVSRETGLSFNTIMLYYFLERILKHLANGKYKNHFVFKGGFLLSNVVGVAERSTIDIDMLLQNMQLSETSIRMVLEETFENTSDDITFEILNVQEIREADQYGGVRVNVQCKLENIKQVVPLDIATGDIVTPNVINYQYISIFGNESIDVYAYPIETILAEKLETIYARGFLNSRSKDYYDVHILYKLKKHEINFEILGEACIKTFQYRNTEYEANKISDLLNILQVDQAFLKRWTLYRDKNSYIDVSFEQVIDDIRELISLLN